jgi:hypothetical protein
MDKENVNEYFSTIKKNKIMLFSGKMDETGNHLVK